MWNLFAALGLGAIHAAVNIRDSWRNADADSRFQMSHHTSELTSTDLNWEEEVPIEGHEEEVYSKLHNDLVAIFGEDYRRRFDLYDRSEIFYNMGTRYFARMLLMSHKGKFAIEGRWGGSVCSTFCTPAKKDDPYWYNLRPKIVERVIYNIRKVAPYACLVPFPEKSHNSWYNSLNQGVGWTGIIGDSRTTNKPIFP